MGFCWTTLNVENMDESINFYESIVGLNLERRAKFGPDMEIAFLGDGETKVELIYDKSIAPLNIGSDVSLGFTTSSLENKLTFLKEKGISIHSGPFQPGPHIKFFFILDPNGLRIQFVENI